MVVRSSRRVLAWGTSLLTIILLPPPPLHPIPALLPWTRFMTRFTCPTVTSQTTLLTPPLPPIAVPNARKASFGKEKPGYFSHVRQIRLFQPRPDKIRFTGPSKHKTNVTLPKCPEEVPLFNLKLNKTSSKTHTPFPKLKRRTSKLADLKKRRTSAAANKKQPSQTHTRSAVMASTRTSPRNHLKSKGVVTDKSSSLEETHNQLSHKAAWDSNSIRVFLELIANEITKGNRPFLVLSQAGYKSLARKFQKKIGRKHGLKQFKNKYMSLKKEWQAWTKLMDSSKGVSEIGFNCDTGMFQAPEEWWDKMESINKVCGKFRKKTLEHRELMETVFMGASATGKHHWTPGEKLPEAADDSSDSVHSLGALPFANLIPNTGVQDVDSGSSLEHVPIEKGKSRKTPSTSVSKSKKARSGVSVIAESMNKLTDVVRTKNQQVTVRHLTGNESLYTISECMHKLSSIPSLIGTPLFHFASTLMDNADYREVMMCQPDDDHIIGWLTQKQLQCTASAPFANLFGGRRM